MGCSHVEVHDGMSMGHRRIMAPLSRPDQSALSLNGTSRVRKRWSCVAFAARYSRQRKFDVMARPPI
jgi:hypothetical protein